MTTSPTLWLTEFVTNLLTADAQANPKIIGLANGNFLVAWEDDNPAAAPGGTGTDIVGVIFDPLGNPVTGSLFLNYDFGFSREEGELDIAARSDGGFVAVYIFPNAAGTETDVIYGVYDAEGTRLPSFGATIGKGFVQDDTSASGFTYSNPSIAVGADDSFFVTYEKDDGTNQDLVGKKISADGVTVGPEVVLRADGFAGGLADNEDIMGPDTVALTNGSFATVYTENDDFGGVAERTVEVLISNADGANSVLINSVSTPDGEPDVNAKIAALADGRFLVSWEENGDLRGSIFFNNGTVDQSDFVITSNPALDFELGDVIGLEDGSYMVAFWDTTGERLFMLRQNNGTQVGFTVFIDPALTAGVDPEVSLDLTTDGRILVSWNKNGDIFTEIFDPRDSGTINAEIGDIATTGRQEDTEILGTAENDELFGVIGNDTIFGFAGDDLLDGGVGDDVLQGGADDDTYILDSAGDTVVELAGEGFDRVIADFKFTAFSGPFANVESFQIVDSAFQLIGNDFDTELIANSALASKVFGYGGEDTLIGGDLNDKLYGGDDSDLIQGGDGKDRVDGGAGADDLFGGQGNDNYFIDDLGDTATEFADEGEDMIKSLVNWTLGDNFENLRLRGTANVGTGNDLDNRIFTVAPNSTLRGEGGNDTLRGSNFADTIYGGNDNDDINGRAGNDDLRGGKGDDRIRGRSGEDSVFGGSGEDELIGGKGDDSIYGGAQMDTLTGEADGDTFFFGDGDYAGTDRLTADRITDFDASEGDLIDLTATDAIAGGADDAFVFIGETGFTGTAGELRVEGDSGTTMLYMDITGNAVADYAIRLDQPIVLDSSDFLL